MTAYHIILCMWLFKHTPGACFWSQRHPFIYPFVDFQNYFQVSPQLKVSISLWYSYVSPVSKVHGANMGPTWVLSAPDRCHIGPMNLAIRVCDLPVQHGGSYISSALPPWQTHCDTVRPYDIRDLGQNCLTHWGRDKTAAISHTPFSNAFSWMKTLYFNYDSTEFCFQRSN